MEAFFRYSTPKVCEVDTCSGSTTGVSATTVTSSLNSPRAIENRISVTRLRRTSTSLRCCGTKPSSSAWMV